MVLGPSFARGTYVQAQHLCAVTYLQQAVVAKHYSSSRAVSRRITCVQYRVYNKQLQKKHQAGQSAKYVPGSAAQCGAVRCGAEK